MTDHAEEISSCLKGCRLPHPFDYYCVSEKWWPDPIRCLIIGETPGSSHSCYFYDSEKPVRVRDNILFGLHGHDLIASPTLSAFKEAGFLFDHAIRCRVRPSKQDWRSAKKYQYVKAEHTQHLDKLLRRVRKVWIMGYVARNAVSCLDSSFPQIQKGLSTPYVQEGSSKYFISRYLLYVGDSEVLKIAGSLKKYFDH